RGAGGSHDRGREASLPPGCRHHRADRRVHRDVRLAAGRRRGVYAPDGSGGDDAADLLAAPRRAYRSRIRRLVPTGQLDVRPRELDSPRHEHAVAVVDRRACGNPAWAYALFADLLHLWNRWLGGVIRLVAA